MVVFKKNNNSAILKFLKRLKYDLGSLTPCQINQANPSDGSSVHG